MTDVLRTLLRPRLVLAITVVICATWGLVAGHLTGGEWGAAAAAAMWWTTQAGTARETKESL